MYLLAVNICFVIFWILLHEKKFIAISAVTILFGWTFVGRNVQLFEKQIPEDDVDRSYKVLSFNVQGFLQRNTVQPDGENLNIFDFLREEDADIICIQEFLTSPWINDLEEKNILRQLGKTPYYHIELPGSNIGIATFSKYPIIRKETIYAHNTANACICSDIVIGNDTVRVYNIHLLSVGFNNDERHLLNNVGNIEYDREDLRTIMSILRNLKRSSLGREKQVEILMAHIESSPYPVIICGDFNEPPISHSYHRIRGERNDAFVEAGTGRSTTYNIGKIASMRIDYIMYSDFFKAYDYKSPRVYI